MPIIFVILIIIVLFVTVYSVYGQLLSYFRSSNNEGFKYKTAFIEIDNIHKFVVEIADTNETRQKGLMNRESLDSDKGMLFIFDRIGVYPFWMKNTLIPLDMIWINEKYEVVYVYSNAKPCSNIASAICNSIIPPTTAKFVLEINGGLAEKLSIQKGSKVNISY